jgi:murein DD-endopeptidase MepM/ murein hydrolase activator NlpD
MAPETEENDEPEVQTVTVEKGDTLSAILAEAGVAPGDIDDILSSLKKVYDPAAIRPGRRLILTLGRINGEAGQPKRTVLMSLKVRPTIQREIVVERNDRGAYETAEIVKTLTEKTDRVQGVIKGSLYQAAMNAGVPEGAIQELIRIYSYDVDFQRDIQAGDKFDVLFTRYYDDQGVPVKLGTVLHAALTLQGERKPLYRFTDPDGQTTDYYTAEAGNGKRMLMKTPIDGARLSSGFGMRRHPILGFNKLHRGTDFAAPTGTPIMASGNGVVEVAGVAGGYGKYIRIRHNDTYKTAYAHMVRFARGMKAGAKVRQGQIIGYVGTTGRSTGPHLHYEVLANNKHVDSQSVKLPTGTVLTGKDLAAFKAEKARLDELIKATPLVNNVAARADDIARP